MFNRRRGSGSWVNGLRTGFDSAVADFGDLFGMVVCLFLISLMAWMAWDPAHFAETVRGMFDHIWEMVKWQ